MTGILRSATSCADTTPSAPPKWSAWLCVKTMRRHRLVAEVLAREGQRRGGTLARRQSVDDDPAGLAFDQRHVGDVEAAQLVDAVGDLEQADLCVQHRMAPQAGVDGGRRGAVDELEGIEVDQYRAVCADDLAFGPGDEASLGVLEILRVVELEVLGASVLRLQRGRRDLGRVGLGRLAATGQERSQGQRRQRRRAAAHQLLGLRFSRRPRR